MSLKISAINVFLAPIFLALTSIIGLTTNTYLHTILLIIDILVMILVTLKFGYIMINKQKLELAEILVLPTYCMAMMLFSTRLIDFNIKIAHVMWLVFFGLQILIMIIFSTYKLYTIKGEFIPGHMIMYIGILSGAISGANYRQVLINHVILWFGCTNLLLLFPSLVKFCFKNRQKNIIVFKMIIIAPFALLYLGLDANDVLSKEALNIFAYILCIITVYGWYLLFRLRTEKFNYSFAALSFPIIINTTALDHFLITTSFYQLFQVYKTFIIIFVLYICMRFLLENLQEIII